MDTGLIRYKSLQISKNLGYSVNERLPLTDVNQVSLRVETNVINRALCLHAVVASSFGFDNSKAGDWLRQEGLFDSLSMNERAFIANGDGNRTQYQFEVEALWTFAWALSFIDELDFGTICGTNLVSLFPNLKRSVTSLEFRQRAALRHYEEIFEMNDLAYCLHWAVTDAHIQGRSIPGKVPPYVVIERRRALEWLFSDTDWDNLTLDT